MGKGIEISFVSDVRDIIKGSNSAEEAIEKISDALDDMARDGDKGAEKVSKSFAELRREAQKAAQESRRTGEEIEAVGRKGRTIDTDVRRGTEGAGDAVREFGDEAKQNMAETFSSFRGEAADFAQIAQDTFGGVVSNLGPIGMAAGAAGALGIGLITAEFERGTERAQEMKQQASELAEQIIDAGGDIRQVPMADVLQSWALELSGTSSAWDLFGDKTQTNLEALSEGAKAAGLDLAGIFTALANSDPSQAARIIEDLSGKLSDVNDEIARHNSARLGGTKIAEEAREEKAAIEDALQVMEERTGITRESIGLADTLSASLQNAKAQQKAETAAVEARAEAANALQSELDEGVSSWQAYINAETGATDPSAYIAAMAQRASATTNFNGNVQALATQFNLSHDEMQAILDQGLGFAPMLQSIIDSGMAPEFIKQIQAAVGGGQEIIDGTPLGATVTVGADTGQAQTQLDQAAAPRTATTTAEAVTKGASAQLDQAAKDRSTTITAKADTKAAEAALAAFATTQRHASVGVSVDLGGAYAALNRFINQPRTTVITAEVRTRDGKAVP